MSTLEAVRPTLVLLATLLPLSGCATNRAVAPAPTRIIQPSEVEAPGRSLERSQADRMLVRRAAVNLEVDDPRGIAARARTVAIGLGGYIERSSESSGNSVHITMRVPAPTLDAALDSVSQLGRVRSRRVSTDDVTEQIVDLDARVATLRAARDRLRRLLESAESIGEIVSVEREVARVQAELEALEARLEFLRREAQLAELTLDAGPRRILGPLGLVLKGVATLVEKLFVIT